MRILSFSDFFILKQTAIFNAKGKLTTYHNTKNTSFHKQEIQITFFTDIFSQVHISSILSFINSSAPSKLRQTSLKTS